MAEITAAMVKELRERTSVGMMDCKKALQECEGNMESAIDWLRQKGLSKAAKKAGRATSEGLIGCKVAPDNSIAAIVEVMCETDFVSRGDKFKTFAADVAAKVFDKDPADAEALTALAGDELNNQIATLGENMSFGRFARYAAQQPGLVGTYIHSNGKIGVMVELGVTKAETLKKPELLELARNLAMQVAATGTIALDASCLDQAIVEREREVYRQKTLDEGKPEKIVDKIVDGRIQKFYQEVCLMEQCYIRDDKVLIKNLVQDQCKALGDTISVRRFVRMQLGETA
ncbi:translation elongation factor Ts [Desulfovibrio sp. OttesenSCG-928-A18]|nr:translation elongation factor Ts [Desulfovibrio sp. OttesenSCG-928-A18]